MALIDLAYTKANFERWQTFSAPIAQGETEDDVLQRVIDQSIIQFGEYIATDDASITDPEKLHLLNIVKYRLFMRLNGEKEFEHKPQIVRDYDFTIAVLKEVRSGENLSPRDVSETPEKDINITGKPPIFSKQTGGWFHE